MGRLSGEVRPTSLDVLLMGETKITGNATFSEITGENQSFDGFKLSY